MKCVRVDMGGKVPLCLNFEMVFTAQTNIHTCTQTFAFPYIHLNSMFFNSVFRWVKMTENSIIFFENSFIDDKIFSTILCLLSFPRDIVGVCHNCFPLHIVNEIHVSDYWLVLTSLFILSNLMILNVLPFWTHPWWLQQIQISLQAVFDRFRFCLGW